MVFTMTWSIECHSRSRSMPCDSRILFRVDILLKPGNNKRFRTIMPFRKNVRSDEIEHRDRCMIMMYVKSVVYYSIEREYKYLARRRWKPLWRHYFLFLLNLVDNEIIVSPEALPRCGQPWDKFSEPVFAMVFHAQIWTQQHCLVVETERKNHERYISITDIISLHISCNKSYKPIPKCRRSQWIITVAKIGSYLITLHRHPWCKSPLRKRCRAWDIRS